MKAKRDLQRYGQRDVTVKRTKRVEKERKVGTLGQEETRTYYSWECDGTATARVTLYIDIDALLDQLGAKAVNNKTGKASAMHGSIEARRTSPIVFRSPTSPEVA